MRVLWRTFILALPVVLRSGSFAARHTCLERVHSRKMAKNGKLKQKTNCKSGAKQKQRKCVLMFDDKDRQDFLTGFHKRKLERRRAALEEMRNKLKEEQKRVREERHKEYLKMLQERREALDEADELEDVITATTESVQYDHPNHTVTVTTISDLDLSTDRLLEPQQRDEQNEEEKTKALPKIAGNPLLSKKIQSLTSSLNSLTKQKRRGKRRSKKEMRRRNHQSEKKSSSTHDNKLRPGRSTKAQRRKRTGQNERNQD
ncbi:nucleolar protein 12 [Ctenopharyngodon idella]|uniref:nucleolar protein 12 n=1 Tax=Ctenopharyngodon idella TaxID=7959 RepID=UPI002230EFE6|nr:nucleolar protein 12 [Ctenopharyngodon idella]